MSTMSTTLDPVAVARAIESRDADAVAAFYADDATLTLIDRDHPPAGPQVLHGREEIHAFYRDVCGRDVEHEVHDAVSTDTGLAYTEHCRYPDGAGVVCSVVSVVDGGRIVSQTAIQVWDG